MMLTKDRQAPTTSVCSPRTPVSLIPRPTREKVTLWIILAALIPLTLASAEHIEFDLRALGGGFGDVANLVARMLPPEVNDPPESLNYCLKHS
ncbi:hypothetical protein [Paeniglutamicibacter sp. Y32M11]|uniref:hypothetical protein n=1 Tax=Paeniglutamicibacter sp. Y32M11 TaxID=2853258 RepID=UPI001C52BF98|nr:hypothetical protein [Paeniglutamicibacter sp. Y32M11]QXQ10086.1 hypothetical protein KUF55_16880 [Paeniglutamicibacter sp. Y32M11]